MIKVCPHDPDHKLFVAGAVVFQLWIVNEKGEYVETLEDGDVHTLPSAENVWECVECGAHGVPAELKLVRGGKN